MLKGWEIGAKSSFREVKIDILRVSTYSYLYWEYMMPDVPVLSDFDQQKTRCHGIFDGAYSQSDTELGFKFVFHFSFKNISNNS